MSPIGQKRLSRPQMAWRAAQDIGDGSYVNLGIGIPELCAEHVPPGRTVTYHTENGVLGFGPPPPAAERDYDLVNAGKKPVTLLPGASFFDHATSFGMIRGGHIDLAILGAFQIAQSGDLANWSTGDGSVPAVGGAMDLVSGARRVVVITEHTTKSGDPKLVERCSYPLTGLGIVSRIYSDLAVIDVAGGRFTVIEIVRDLDPEVLRRSTGAELHFAEGLKEMAVPPL